MIQNLLEKFREIQNKTSWDAYEVSCHLFRNNNEILESCGTGIFLKILDDYFLITVAHVAESLNFEFYVGLEKHTIFKLGGNLVTNKTNNRDKDKFDICVLKLCSETIENISKTYNFLNLQEININHDYKNLPLYELVGFPATKSKYNKYKKKLYSKAYRYITTPVLEKNIYKNLKCSTSYNVILNYDRKKVYNYKKKSTQIGPELEGISGCGLWYTPVEEITSKEKPKKYLVAIITEWPINDRKYLIATKIDLFTEVIRQHFKIDIPKSSITFSITK